MMNELVGWALSPPIIMPIFEYKCPSCGKMQELLVKSGTGKAPDCPDCGKKMDKQFSSFAAVVREPSKIPPQCQGCPKGCHHSG